MTPNHSNDISEEKMGNNNIVTVAWKRKTDVSCNDEGRGGTVPVHGELSAKVIWQQVKLNKQQRRSTVGVDSTAVADLSTDGENVNGLQQAGIAWQFNSWGDKSLWFARIEWLGPRDGKVVFREWYYIVGRFCYSLRMSSRRLDDNVGVLRLHLFYVGPMS